MPASHEDLLRSMQSPSFYPHNPPSVELVQTHISYVFIAGDRVYKVKKPVDFGFLDFSTLEKRKHFCEEELRLNTRLAPAVYGSVEPITEDGAGNLVLGGTGPVVEYALIMKRLPEEKMLFRLLKEGSIDLSVMDAIARRIYDFHQAAETGGEIDKLGGIETIRRNHDENFDQTLPYIDRTISVPTHRFLKKYADAFLRKNELLFQRRVANHRIRDCHGDLHLQHICLHEGEIVIFDCIEFNERFRYLDVAAEIAFLSMDLDGNGFGEHGRTFVDAYLRYSGDREIMTLLNFYRCYFAFVRGKVTSFRLEDPATAEKDRTDIIAEASRYFDRAAGYAARPEKGTLIAMSGLMGTGKSVLSGRIGTILNAPVIQTDVLRKAMLGIQPTERHHVDYGRGIYSEEISRNTYRQALEKAESVLATGGTVLMDASFRSRCDREEARNLAGRLGADFFLVECRCPESQIKERLERRLTKSEQASDGRWELFESQKQNFEPPEEIPFPEHVVADTSQPHGEAVFSVLEKIRGLS